MESSMLWIFIVAVAACLLFVLQKAQHPLSFFGIAFSDSNKQHQSMIPVDEILWGKVTWAVERNEGDKPFDFAQLVAHKRMPVVFRSTPVIKSARMFTARGGIGWDWEYLAREFGNVVLQNTRVFRGNPQQTRYKDETMGDSEGSVEGNMTPPFVFLLASNRQSANSPPLMHWSVNKSHLHYTETTVRLKELVRACNASIHARGRRILYHSAPVHSLQQDSANGGAKMAAQVDAEALRSLFAVDTAGAARQLRLRAGIGARGVHVVAQGACTKTP